ncbi:hypothetical protein P5673_022798 [Acropora cervicornis]|uniref:Uncharacterized protein n=1 Tax=Acropora cervicornis TaxID=6130 RepID=A0AAD9Q6D7_ACRCE|nr:hypothetical protein P5673_022798 [Acropora cervicornis]
MLSAAPRASLTLPSCSPNYPCASRIGWTLARHCPFLKKHIKFLLKQPGIQGAIQFPNNIMVMYDCLDEFRYLNWSSLEKVMASNKSEFRPEKTNLVEMREQFRLQPRLSESLNVGIRLGDMQYTLETEVFEELQDRRPIVIDPTLVRAAQLADIHLLNEAMERGNDVKFLVQMCFRLEEEVRVLVITLGIFSGRRDPQWTVDTNHPKFDEIQQLLKDARMHNFTYSPEQMPARLGYKGFLVKSENNVELIVGNETVRLQQLLLESIPEDVLPHKNRDWVLAAINAGNVKAGAPY